MPLNDPARQPAVLARLIAILGRDRLGHGYVFTGEPGIGKRDTALRFAQALLCTEPGDAPPCGGCSACGRVAAGAHPDLHRLGPENRVIKVEMVRGLQEAMALKTYEGGRRVVIIEDAETMNEAAANAFLKTLEEPPPGTVLILLTARPELLPATILSRAQPVRFRPLSREQIREFLEAEGLDDVDQRVRLAEGRLDVGGREDLVAFHRKVAEDVASLLTGDLDVKEVWAGRDEALAWLDGLTCILRDETVAEVTRDGALLANPERTPRIPTASTGDGRVRELLGLAREVADLRSRFRFNLNLAVSLQWIGFHLRGRSKRI